MKWFALVLCFGISSFGCGGNGNGDGDTCNAIGQWSVTLTLGDGDFLEPGTLTDVLTIKAAGSSVTITDSDGETADLEMYNAETCAIGLGEQFHAPETAETYEINGITTVNLVFDGDTATGDGVLLAEMNIEGELFECTQDLTLKGTR